MRVYANVTEVNSMTYVCHDLMELFNINRMHDLRLNHYDNLFKYGVLHDVVSRFRASK